MAYAHVYIATLFVSCKIDYEMYHMWLYVTENTHIIKVTKKVRVVINVANLKNTSRSLQFYLVST